MVIGKLGTQVREGKLSRTQQRRLQEATATEQRRVERERQELATREPLADPKIKETRESLEQRLQRLNTDVESIEKQIGHRQSVGDTTTLHFLSAQKSQSLKVKAELESRISTLKGLEGRKVILTPELKTKLQEIGEVTPLFRTIGRAVDLATFTAPTQLGAGDIFSRKEMETTTFGKEAERYEKFGYSKSESQILAQASLERGGITFTPQKAQEIISTGISTSKGIKTATELSQQKVKALPTILQPKPITDIQTFLTRGGTQDLKEQPFDIREPFGIFGKARTGIEGFTERIGTKIEERMFGVAERGGASKIIDEGETVLARSISEEGKILRGGGIITPSPEREPFNIFAEAVKLTGKIATLPVLAIEKVSALILKGEARQQVFGIKELQETKFKTGITKTGQEFFIPVDPLSPREKIELGIDIGLGTAMGFGAFRGAKRFTFDPKITEIKLREIKIPKAEELQFTVIAKGKEFRIGEFTIRGETQPPKVIIETTKAREFFGLQPKQVKIKPAREFTVKTLEPVIAEQPFFVGEVRGVRPSKVRVSKLEGFQTKVDLRQFEQLHKIDKFLLQREAEALTGLPVSLEHVPKILGRKEERILSTIISEKQLKIGKPSKTRIDIDKFGVLGKKTIRSEAVSNVRTILESDKFRMAQIDTFFKDVTKPFARATGKTPKLETTLLELKEPIFLDEVTDVKFLKPADIKKTSLDQTFQLAQQKQIIRPLPKPTIKEPSTKVSKLAQDIMQDQARNLIGLPRAVGGAGLTEAQLRQFRGGVAPDVEFIVLPPSAKTPQLPDLTTKIRIDVKQVDMVETTLGLKPVTQVKTGLRMKDMLKEQLKLIEVQIPKEILKERAKQQEKLISKLMEKQITKEQLKLIESFKIVPPPPVPKPEITRTPTTTPIKKRLPLPVDIDLKGKDIVRAKVKRRKDKLFAFVESFTARALALEPVEIVLKKKGLESQLEKIQRLRTPFDIRRKPIIKIISPKKRKRRTKK